MAIYDPRKFIRKDCTVLSPESLQVLRKEVPGSDVMVDIEKLMRGFSTSEHGGVEFYASLDSNGLVEATLVEIVSRGMNAVKLEILFDIDTGPIIPKEGRIIREMFKFY